MMTLTHFLFFNLETDVMVKFGVFSNDYGMQVMWVGSYAGGSYVGGSYAGGSYVGGSYAGGSYVDGSHADGSYMGGHLCQRKLRR